MYEINFHTKISSARFTGLSIVFSSFPVFGQFESTKFSSIRKVLDGKVRNFSPTKISSFTVPSFPWSAEDKLIPVVLERCYVPFTSAKVVLFLCLFSPFHLHRFLNLFGMVELHLRTFAVAGDHGRKFFSWEFRAHSDSKYSVLDPAARPIDCTVNSYEN